MIDLTLDDREVRAALDRLQRRLSDMTPVMREIGELLTERARQRFFTSTGPDGQRWAPNKPSTLESYLRGYYGGAHRGKRGGLTKKAAARAAAKKPLIGESKALSTTVHYQAGRDSVTIGSPMVYAAIQQFGGQAGRGKRVSIPARPFLPVTQSGQWLGTEDRSAILDILREAIESAANPHG